MTNKPILDNPILDKRIKKEIDAATQPLLNRIHALEMEATNLTSEKARILAGLVAARAAIYHSSLELPYPGKFGLQTILANMDKTINGEDR